MSDAVQRWRLVFARGQEARGLAHKDVAAAWEAALRASGLPLAVSDSAHRRPRMSFAAPVPVGMLAERELIDIGLAGRCRRHEVRESLEPVVPPGHLLVDLYDVWVGDPSLGGAVVAADYRVRVPRPDGESNDRHSAGVAVAAMLAERELKRGRAKGIGVVTVDVRPLLVDLRIADPRAVPPGDGGSVELWMRLRLGGEGRVGRPEEVVAILGDRIGCALVVEEVVRERIILAGESA